MASMFWQVALDALPVHALLFLTAHQRGELLVLHLEPRVEQLGELSDQQPPQRPHGADQHAADTQPGCNLLRGDRHAGPSFSPVEISFIWP